ncbi:UNVERIFIED_ORG: hypothetical protein M2442_005198, partial [Methylorubrum zatmanii]|nr:hypothetical protein [Methylorubrum zatmanii]
TGRNQRSVIAVCGFDKACHISFPALEERISYFTRNFNKKSSQENRSYIRDETAFLISTCVISWQRCGTQAIECSWMVSGVAAYDADFDATGGQAGRLDQLATSGRRIKGDRLRDLANGTQQVICGEFQAYADASTTVPVLIVRAIDSSFYEVAADDTHVLQNLKATFRDVRSA